MTCRPIVCLRQFPLWNIAAYDSHRCDFNQCFPPIVQSNVKVRRLVVSRVEGDGPVAQASSAIRVSRDRPNLIHDEDDDDQADRIHLLRQTLAQIGWVGMWRCARWVTVASSRARKTGCCRAFERRIARRRGPDRCLSAAQSTTRFRSDRRPLGGVQFDSAAFQTAQELTFQACFLNPASVRTDDFLNVFASAAVETLSDHVVQEILQMDGKMDGHRMHWRLRFFAG